MLLRLVYKRTFKYAIYSHFEKGIHESKKNDLVWKTKCAALYSEFPRLGHHHVTIKQLIKHTGSFTGKDFKAITQIGPMLYGCMFPQYRKLWISLSLMTKMLYTQPNCEMETFIQKLDFVIQVFCRQVTQHFERIKTHMKLHTLVHMAKFYTMYGPLQLYDAEEPESENGTVRKFVQNSNRHNSSRDMAERFSVYEHARALMLGLWSVDNEKVLEPGIALQTLMAFKSVRKTVEIRKNQEHAFQIKKNEFCWIDDQLYRIILPKNPLSMVQRLLPTVDCDNFGNRIFRLEAEVIEVSACDIGDYAHAFHHCSGCRITDTKVIHTESLEFVLNAYRFKERDPEYLSRISALLL
jgi:hypothetical protein